MRRWLAVIGTVAGLATGALVNGSPASAAATGSPTGPAITAGVGAGQDHWVGSWETATARNTNEHFTGVSIRNVVHLSVGGSAVRVRLSNAFGTAPLVLGHVTVARAADASASPAAVPGTMREARFHGQRSVTAAPGGDVRSDPVPLAVPARGDLLVTVFLASDAGPVTFHSVALQTSYRGEGDLAADPTGAAFTTQTSSWYYLTGVDVRDAPAAGAVVTLGDSITDSLGSTYGANVRWPDLLAERLLARPPSRRLGVMNAGISGNRLLLDGTVDAFGPRALDRLDRDVLSRSAVRTVLVMEGINDIQQSPHQLDPTVITSALRTIADRAHARGLRVVGATLTPFEGWRVYDETLEAVRQAVNAFIRTSGAFDAVVDFDAVLRDPADGSRLLPAYDSGDHLHPGDAGYRAMANAVDLHTL